MKIEWIHIKGFRNFIDEKISFKDQTLIIGANDIGKTNLVYALRLLFDRSLSELDLDLYTSDYNIYESEKSIKITVKIIEVKEDCLKTVFKENIENETVYIQYQNSINEEYSIWCGPLEDKLELRDNRFYINRLNMEYVNTNRNLKSFIKRERNQLLEQSKLNITTDKLQNDKKSKETIDKYLKKISSEIDELNYIQESLNKVNSELSSLAIHNEEKELKFRNSDSDSDKLLENLELTYNTDEGELTLGGDGRNNQIFLATWVSKQKEVKSMERVTFYAVEEPEAHLHPHQQRKLSSYLLSNFDEQIFITTHSPHIATEFTPDKIVKLNYKDKCTTAAQGGCSKKTKLIFDDFGYRLNAITSDVFFVNAVFLVEGPSEYLFYSSLSQELGIDLDRLNVSIISVDGVGFKPYIKICLALDIPFILRTDNDIFKKSKKISGKSIELYYNAGISRIMGIYEELLCNNNKLIDYWKDNELKNEWPIDIDRPEESLELERKIIEEINKNNIYLSKKDLENDLVNSELLDVFKKFYKTDTQEETVVKMQKSKATNMIEFLSEYHSDLKKLKDDDISEPIKSLEQIVKKGSC